MLNDHSIGTGKKFLVLNQTKKGRLMMGKIGLQLFTVRKEAEKNLLGTVEKAADMGYEGVQFAGFFDTSANQLKKIMEDKSIQPAGAHVGIDQLLGDRLEESLDYNERIGNRLIICPALPREMRKNADDYRKTAEKLNKIGEKCKKLGFTFGYHNHDFEFELFDGQTGFEILFENTDAALVKMELDCAWASYAGYEPIEIIKKYQDRCVSLHVKDLKKYRNKKVSTEIGNGYLNIAQLVETGKQHGVEWFTVEQEDYEREPMESAKINAVNLKQILTGIGA
jgi:sugar phosphate isomerase/epimerase